MFLDEVKKTIISNDTIKMLKEKFDEFNERIPYFTAKFNIELLKKQLFERIKNGDYDKINGIISGDLFLYPVRIYLPEEIKKCLRENDISENNEYGFKFSYESYFKEYYIEAYNSLATFLLHRVNNEKTRKEGFIFKKEIKWTEFEAWYELNPAFKDLILESVRLGKEEGIDLSEKKLKVAKQNSYRDYEEILITINDRICYNRACCCVNPSGGIAFLKENKRPSTSAFQFLDSETGIRITGTVSSFSQVAIPYTLKIQ